MNKEYKGYGLITKFGFFVNVWEVQVVFPCGEKDRAATGYSDEWSAIEAGKLRITSLINTERLLLQNMIGELEELAELRKCHSNTGDT